MEKVTITSKTFPDTALFDLLNRESALWITNGVLDTIEDPTLVARLLTLPWRVVLCEEADPALISEIERLGTLHDELSRHRGFVHIVASDPTLRHLPDRALPVYLLNGRDDASVESDSSRLSGIAAMRRTLNMIGRLEASLPRRVVVVTTAAGEAAQQLSQMWEQEFRALVTFAVPADFDAKSLIDLFESAKGLSSLSIVSASLVDFSKDLISRVTEQLPDSTVRIRVKGLQEDINEVDITSAELIEQPFLDKFSIIKTSDLWQLSEFDLTGEDLNAFFDKSQHSWRAYAAGLPWMFDKSPVAYLLAALRKAHLEGSESNRLLYITSQSGAGGTTIARKLAYEAASSGYPTLVANSQTYQPNATEVSTFLNRALPLIREATPGQDAGSHTSKDAPWLLVFDREHWSGHQQALNNFLAELTRSGRTVIILKVFEPELPSELFNIPGNRELCNLTHELDKQEVLSLGEHLNRFLKPLGLSKGENEWIRFWELHKPDLDTSIAAFWITLEFWLKGFIDLGESIQSWIYRQYQDASLSREMRHIVLEIAALTVERRSVPEHLFPIPRDVNSPLSVLLEDLRTDVPGFALIRQDFPVGRYWAMAHDVLGRYLLNSVYYDRVHLRELGFDSVTSPVELRLQLLARVTIRSTLGEPRFQSYALQFAVKTLKLDEAEGNAEFFQYWRLVLDILDSFPNSVLETSRAFNHHVAISRRRVATGNAFEVTVQERRALLVRAIDQLEFALNSLTENKSDESNLNLYNSLALAYQNWADLELQEEGATSLVQNLRKKANEATLNALRENPSNPYVLETAARNLLQQGKIDPDEALTTAAEALGYVFQATTLENSGARQYKLGQLANDALRQLRAGGATAVIERMKNKGNPMGFLAAAWLELTKEYEEIDAADPSIFSKESTESALSILRDSPRHWILVRLEYDLLSALEPRNYTAQLELLEELDSFSTYSLPLQMRLEQAILFHLVGRHREGNNAFGRLRQAIREQNAILVVPGRLKWLRVQHGDDRLMCRATVADDMGYRSMAQVVELKNARVPFIPQDFGHQKMPVGQQFRCYITFGAMGPFIKPPTTQLVGQ